MTVSAACTPLSLPSIRCRSFINSSFMSALLVADGCCGKSIVAQGVAGAFHKEVTHG